VRIIHERCENILDNSGKVIKSLGMVHDITERKLTEQQQQELLDRERNIAEVLQQAVMPPEVPSEILGYSVAVTYRPALKEAEIGGHFYDVFELADGKLAVLIGDVAGKGLQAALRVASARHAIRSYAYLDPSPGKVMTLANEALCRDKGDETQILTAFYALLDPKGCTFTYSSAGHEPPVICSTTGNCEELKAAGLPLGLVENTEYSQFTRRFDPGDLIVMVTDGITEARAPGPELFGKERLIAFLEEHKNISPNEAVAGIMNAATVHAGGQLQDDAAIVALTPNKE